MPTQVNPNLEIIGTLCKTVQTDIPSPDDLILALKVSGWSIAGSEARGFPGSERGRAPTVGRFGGDDCNG